MYMKKILFVLIFTGLFLSSNFVFAIPNDAQIEKMCTKFTKQLKYGYGFVVVGNRVYVKELQQALVDGGYLKTKVDGLFGRKTEIALKEYQKQNGLKETGILDSNSINSFRARFCDVGSSGGGGGAICDYPAPPTGCTYVQGPQYNQSNMCGMVLSCQNQESVADSPNCKVYNDGCNTCSRTEVGGKQVCTMRACFAQGKAYCQEYF